MSRKRDKRRSIMLDVAFPTNQKLRGASPSAKWLDVVGMCFSGQNLTDSEINPSVVCALAGVQPRYAQELIKRGRWHESGHDCADCPQPAYEGDVVIHDYLKHQTSSLEFQEITELRATAGRSGNHRRYGHKGRVADCAKCN